MKRKAMTLEGFVLGAEDEGIAATLGLSPERFQKMMDDDNDDFDKEFERIKKENRQYILDEKIERTLSKMTEFVRDKKVNPKKYPEFDTNDDWVVIFKQALSISEMEILKELMEKEGLK
ncbi:hypothetical protein SAMN05444673_4006 [Bacillus sp. OV166]|uniref:hypothetical protein n=1 Tax=Bacillus sp. OV166 TaxID=1882763 RepID=UPI000A2ABAFA|nr:hypothetical protein [Bacillus sp. OV166]SMQ80853.1 hypothetical protein SAMN05444673_4006 [Bacillus sp. OV166]